MKINDKQLLFSKNIGDSLKIMNQSRTCNRQI